MIQDNLSPSAASRSLPPEVILTVNGKPVKARAGETIVHALWVAGLAEEIRVGCAGGVCGACTVTVRCDDSRPGGTDLACMRPVEDGMKVFAFPVDDAPARAPVTDPDAARLRAVYPTLDRCTKCNNCTVACPMNIPVMDSVLRMQKGELEAAAEDFTTCIHCGLCRAVCEDRVQPHNMGIWVRRSLGMTREYPALDQLVEDADNAEAEWDYLLNCDPEERMRRARQMRETGRLPG